MLPQPWMVMGTVGDTQPFAAICSHWEVAALSHTPHTPPQYLVMELKPDEMQSRYRQGLEANASGRGFSRNTLILEIR